MLAIEQADCRPRLCIHGVSEHLVLLGPARPPGKPMVKPQRTLALKQPDIVHLLIRRNSLEITEPLIATQSIWGHTIRDFSKH